MRCCCRFVLIGQRTDCALFVLLDLLLQLLIFLFQLAHLGRLRILLDLIFDLLHVTAEE